MSPIGLWKNGWLKQGFCDVLKLIIVILGFVMLFGFNKVIAIQPIVDYQSMTKKDPVKPVVLNMISLRHRRVSDIQSFLRSICMECEWILDDHAQRVGLQTTQVKWDKLRPQIRQYDQRIPLIQIVVEVVEVVDVNDATYRHFLSELSGAYDSKKVSKDGLPLNVQYLIESGKAALVSTPRILTQSGQLATIRIGDRVPYTTIQVSAGANMSNVNYMDTGISLKIKPVVQRNRRIDMDIDFSYQTVNGWRRHQSQQYPMLANRSTRLRVNTKSGVPIMFAGLLDSTQHEQIQKVPLLGDLPLIGVLFQSKKTTRRQSDLLYRITPTIQ